MLPPPVLRVENKDFQATLDDQLAKLEPDDFVGRKRLKMSYRSYSKVLQMPELETNETMKQNQDCLFQIQFSPEMINEGYHVPGKLKRNNIYPILLILKIKIDDEVKILEPWATKVNLSLTNDTRVKISIGGVADATQEGDELNIEIPRKVLEDTRNLLLKVREYTDWKDDNNNSGEKPKPAFFPVSL